jgi:hypothetical protein
MKTSHKEKIASAHRGKSHTSATKKKISNALSGEPSNFANKKHNKDTKDIIGDKRGHDDRIEGRKWIVNRFNSKTFRKYSTPDQRYQYGRRVKSYREWLDHQSL